MPQHRYEIRTMDSISGYVYITEARLRKIDGYQPLQLFDIDINDVQQHAPLNRVPELQLLAHSGSCAISSARDIH
jgi:hypothetical protein